MKCHGNGKVPEHINKQYYANSNWVKDSVNHASGHIWAHGTIYSRVPVCKQADSNLGYTGARGVRTITIGTDSTNW